jgi:hypothetical protein
MLLLLLLADCSASSAFFVSFAHRQAVIQDKKTDAAIGTSAGKFAPKGTWERKRIYKAATGSCKRTNLHAICVGY